MFDLDDFVAAVVAARAEPNSVGAVKEVLDRALAEPTKLAAALPPERAELQVLYGSAEVTILKMVWAPGMTIPPHDHRMWAVNGIYAGGEDNAFFRRGPEGGLVPAGGRRIGEAESAMLGRDVIHAVTNPRAHACTGSIHIYGGDFMNQPRSMWDAEALEEGPADGETVRRLFEEANARMR